MQRRSFFRWLAGMGAFTWLHAQGSAVGLDESALGALAAMVLPASLGRAGTDKVAQQFAAWCRDYREDADLGYGYGHPRTRRSGPNPARNYPRQLAALGPAPTRAAVEAALDAAAVTALPRRPNGGHVASDLMSFYFTSAAGNDYLYRAAILREACRGFERNAENPSHAS
ncbi:MAG TPA: hypothetical protein VIC32_01485 [Terriglobales bacterium]|jgi:hypothetical protein